jgi:hypothetical protein
LQLSHQTTMSALPASPMFHEEKMGLGHEVFSYKENPEKALFNQAPNDDYQFGTVNQDLPRSATLVRLKFQSHLLPIRTYSLPQNPPTKNSNLVSIYAKEAIFQERCSLEPRSTFHAIFLDKRLLVLALTLALLIFSVDLATKVRDEEEFVRKRSWLW